MKAVDSIGVASSGTPRDSASRTSSRGACSPRVRTRHETGQAASRLSAAARSRAPRVAR